MVASLPAALDPSSVNIAEQLLIGPHVRPERPAVTYNGDAVSYSELRSRVFAFANRLLEAGLEPGDRVALRLPNTPDFAVAWLAVQWVGAIGVSLPPAYRRREIGHVVNHSGSRVVVCASELRDPIEEARPRFLQPVSILQVPAADHDSTGVPPHRAAGSLPATLTYISSADGTLKGAVQNRADVLAAAVAYPRDVLRIEPDDICTGTIGLCWAFGVGSLLTAPLRAGASALLLESASVMGLLQAIATSRPTILFGAPTTYRMLLRKPDLESFDMQSIRCCVSAAEPLPPWVSNEWRSRTGLEILDGLGTTELAHVFISNRSGDSRPGFIGKPVAGYEARIVDDRFCDVPSGVPGRLLVRGLTAARYWRDDDAQARAVHDGWSLSGDVCVEEDGWFRHVRRTDSLIVSAGYKISALEVERVLEEHSEVSRANVFAVPDLVRGHVVKAVVSPARDVNTTGLVERLHRYLQRELATYKCPKEIQILQAGEFTSTAAGPLLR